MSTWVSVGAHQVRCEPSVVFCRYVGALSLTDIKAVHAILDREIAEHGRTFFLVDARQFPGASPEVRKWLASGAGYHKLGGVVFFGASATVEASATMIERASRMVSKLSSPPIRFFATEAEARAWIAELRAASPSSA